MAKVNYYIDGDGGNNLYNTLKEIRVHVSLQSQTDRDGYNGMFIGRVNDERYWREISVKGRKIAIKRQS